MQNIVYCIKLASLCLISSHCEDFYVLLGEKVSIKPCYTQHGKLYSSAGNVACVGVHGQDFYPLNLDLAIVTSSVDFQLFLLNFRSQEVSYVLSVAKEKSTELKRGSRVFDGIFRDGGGGFSTAMQMFSIWAGKQILIVWVSPAQQAQRHWAFLLPVSMLNSYPQFFTDATVCLEISLRVRVISRCLGHSLRVCGEERLLLLAYSCMLLWALVCVAYLVWNRSGFSFVSRWEGRGVSYQSVGHVTSDERSAGVITALPSHEKLLA